MTRALKTKKMTHVVDGSVETDLDVLINDYKAVDLRDVNITPGAGVDGYVVYYNDTSGKFELKVESGGSTSLVTLTDVDITTGAGVDGYIIYYNDTTGKFELKEDAGGVTSLVALTDTFSTLSGGAGKILSVNGAEDTVVLTDKQFSQSTRGAITTVTYDGGVTFTANAEGDFGDAQNDQNPLVYITDGVVNETVNVESFNIVGGNPDQFTISAADAGLFTTLLQTGGAVTVTFADWTPIVRDLGGITSLWLDPSGDVTIDQSWERLAKESAIITSFADLDDTPVGIPDNQMLMGSGGSLVFSDRIYIGGKQSWVAEVSGVTLGEDTGNLTFSLSDPEADEYFPGHVVQITDGVNTVTGSITSRAGSDPFDFITDIPADVNFYDTIVATVSVAGFFNIVRDANDAPKLILSSTGDILNESSQPFLSTGSALSELSNVDTSGNELPGNSGYVLTWTGANYELLASAGGSGGVSNFTELGDVPGSIEQDRILVGTDANTLEFRSSFVMEQEFGQLETTAISLAGTVISFDVADAAGSGYFPGCLVIITNGSQSDLITNVESIATNTITVAYVNGAGAQTFTDTESVDVAPAIFQEVLRNVEGASVLSVDPTGNLVNIDNSRFLSTGSPLEELSNINNSDYTDGNVLTWVSASGEYQLLPSAGGGASDFTSLNDTPGGISYEQVLLGREDDTLVFSDRLPVALTQPWGSNTSATLTDWNSGTQLAFTIPSNPDYDGGIAVKFINQGDLDIFSIGTIINANDNGDGSHTYETDIAAGDVFSAGNTVDIKVGLGGSLIVDVHDNTKLGMFPDGTLIDENNNPILAYDADSSDFTDGNVLTWNNGTGMFYLTTPAGGSSVVQQEDPPAPVQITNGNEVFKISGDATIQDFASQGLLSTLSPGDTLNIINTTLSQNADVSVVSVTDGNNITIDTGMVSSLGWGGGNDLQIFTTSGYSEVVIAQSGDGAGGYDPKLQIGANQNVQVETTGGFADVYGMSNYERISFVADAGGTPLEEGTHYFVACDPTTAGAQIPLTLPDDGDVTQGYRITVAVVTPGSVQVSPFTGDTINGSTSPKTLTGTGTVVHFVCMGNGLGWLITGQLGTVS